MSNAAVAQWARTLSTDGRPRAAGLFRIVNGWEPTLLELAAWMRWMALAPLAWRIKLAEDPEPDIRAG